MGARQGKYAALEGIDPLPFGHAAQGLRGDRLHDGEGVLEPVGELAIEHDLQLLGAHSRDADLDAVGDVSQERQLFLCPDPRLEVVDDEDRHGASALAHRM